MAAGSASRPCAATAILHSAYPTAGEDAVFLGPDSYRFADLIGAELEPDVPPTARIVDIGTGAGVGAVTAASHCRGARVVATDINPLALRLAQSTPPSQA